MCGERSTKSQPSFPSPTLDIGVVQALVDVQDVEGQYNEIVDWLKIPGDALQDRMIMVERLNEAAVVALKAHRLFLKVRRVCQQQRRKALAQVREIKRTATLRIKEWQHMHGGGKALSDKMIDEEIVGSPSLSERWGKVMDEVEQLDATVEAFEELWKRTRGRESLLQSQSRLAFPDKMVNIQT